MKSFQRKLFYLRLRHFLSLFIPPLLNGLILFISGAGLILSALSRAGNYLYLLRGAALFILIIPFIYTFIVIIRRVRLFSLKELNRLLREDIPQIEDSLVNTFSLLEEMDIYRDNPVAAAAIENSLDNLKFQLINSTGMLLSLKKFYRSLFSVLLIGGALLFSYSNNPVYFEDSFEIAGRLMRSESLFSIQVIPGNASVTPRSDLEIKALTGYSHPPEIEVRRLGESYSESFSKRVSTYTYTLRDIREDIRYRVIIPGYRSQWYEVNLIRPPRPEKISLYYYYPEYTAMESESAEGPDIEAVRGTRVVIRAQIEGDYYSARLRTDGGYLDMSKDEENKLRGELTLSEESYYSILLYDADERLITESARYPVRVIEDRAPVVELSFPREDIEAPPHARIGLSGSASDDFGVASVYIEYHIDVGGRSRRELIRDYPPRPRNTEFSHTWDISSLRLLPGSVITYRILAEDSNNLYGPGVGYSGSRRIIITGFRDEHKKLLSEAEELEEDLLNMLESSFLISDSAERGDFSSALEDMSGVKDDARSLEDKLGDILDRMEKDPHLERATLEEFKGLKRASESLNNRLLPRLEEELLESSEAALETSSELSDSIERMLSVLSDSLKRERMSDMLTAGADSIESADRLSEMLRDGSAAPEEIIRELDNLVELMQELFEAASRASGDLPEEFINSESVQGLDFEGTQDMMRELSEALSNGDFERAAEIIESLSSSIRSMQEALLDAAGSSRSDRMDTLSDRGDELSEELNRIIEKEREIIRETEEITSLILERREISDKVRIEELRGLYAELKSTTGFTSREADIEFSQNYLRETPQIIREGIEGAEEPFIRERLEEFLQELTRVYDDTYFLEEEEKESLRGLGEKQYALKERADVLIEAFRAISYQTAILPPELIENLSSASSHMVRASAYLKDTLPSEALPEERRALAYLLEASSDMESFMETLSEMPSGFQGGASSGLHSAGGAPGRSGYAERRVEIPGAGEATGGREFREMIMEALRREHPERYRELIEEYFRSLGE